MKLKPSIGLDYIKFGMTELEVIALLGNPDVITKDVDDEDNNTIYQYNDLKLRLTFYTNEGNRLAYIKTTNPKATIDGFSIIDQKLNDVITNLKTSPKDWLEENYFSFNAYFNVDRWLTLHEEYGRVTNIEMGTTYIPGTEETFWPN